jgi:hypothetical protein
MHCVKDSTAELEIEVKGDKRLDTRADESNENLKIGEKNSRPYCVKL